MLWRVFLREKSYIFALRVVKLSRYLQTEYNEYILSKQVLRSGTAVAALVSEAKYAQSKKDFVNKLSVALKEANETDYWMRLLRDSDYINTDMYQSLSPEILELLKLLTASINTVKKQDV